MSVFCLEFNGCESCSRSLELRVGLIFFGRLCFLG